MYRGFSVKCADGGTTEWGGRLGETKREIEGQREITTSE
jgi:hypothetical protein